MVISTCTCNSASILCILNFVSLLLLEHPPSELPKIKYDIERKADGFKVTCISLDPSVDNCVVVRHQRLPVDNHLDITLYVYQLGSVGDITSGYIYVANPEDYQIAVIGGTRKARKPTCKCMCTICSHSIRAHNNVYDTVMIMLFSCSQYKEIDLSSFSISVLLASDTYCYSSRIQKVEEISRYDIHY